MLKRALLAISGRIKKIIIIALLFFIISNLVIATLSIKKASENSIDFARKSLSTEVMLQPDMDKLREQVMANRENGIQGGFGIIERPKIYLNDVLDLGNSEYVSDFRYGFSTSAIEVDFIALENSNFGRGSENSQNIQIEAVNAFALIDKVKNSEIILKSGDVFDETTEESVIISIDLALENELEVNDIIKLKNIDDVINEFTIIGIYDDLSDNTMSRTNPGNIIYTNVDSGKLLLPEDSLNDGNIVLSNAVFYLDDSENLDAFLNEGNTLLPDLEEKNLLFGINNAAYEQMIGPISSVGDLSLTILLVVVIAGAVILSLLVTNSINSRQYEIGVLLSLGEKKIKIIGQLLLELMIVIVVAGGLSVATSNIISNKIAGDLLEKQLSITEEQSQNNFGRGPDKFNNMNNIQVDTIDEINVSIGMNEYINLFGIGSIIVFISMIIPSLNIMKYSPKEILSKREG